MIKPTVGRVIWYWPSAREEGEQPWAGMIVKVWNDRLINVGGFDPNGNPFKDTSVQLLQDDDEVYSGAHVRWMPYQKGQAAKTESLEQSLKIT